mmetsp:Transcript_2104/g.5374  ORF Transcript_2104/g.5374 Transcript_2104/m.5374 type:complete len:193 (-) Transcript_2104:188-766(-)
MVWAKDDKDMDAVAVALPCNEIEEAILVSEAKVEAMPVADVCVAEEDQSDAVKVSLDEMEIRADPDAVRLRALSLRDAIVTNRPLDLRSDATSGLLEDAGAVGQRDSDRGCTVLHHAAMCGRVTHLGDLLRFADVNLPGGSRRLCDARDDLGNRPIDLAVQAGHADCVDLLERYYDADDVKRTDDADHPQGK